MRFAGSYSDPAHLASLSTGATAPPLEIRPEAHRSAATIARRDVMAFATEHGVGDPFRGGLVADAKPFRTLSCTRTGTVHVELEARRPLQVELDEGAASGSAFGSGGRGLGGRAELLEQAERVPVRPPGDAPGIGVAAPFDGWVCERTHPRRCESATCT